ncbi:MAG: fatty acid desaturase [Sandaracinaceae bacterium]|nr:fatty acid desaturase [Sandaracinaceae bacterium]MDW8245974.1 fatty acid desaturase [Sandaracinaceae bacterium]
MAALPEIRDPVFVPGKAYGLLERVALRLIRDERDLPFVKLSIAMTLVLIPLAVLLYWPGVFRWWMAPIYWGVLYGFFADRYILMLHNTSHRPLWKREYSFLNFYIPWVLGPFAGETPETYYIHHITMHHAEGNLPRDLSSTMKYQRDSAIDFAKYWLDFFFLSMYKLGRYQLSKGRTRLFVWMMVGEWSFYLLVAFGIWYNWRATVVVFVVPFLVARFVMMAGNWAQHAFVCPNDPGSSYKSSITCINHRYNRRCFNDGYHISHHVKATRHWTEHPRELIENLEEYRRNEAIIFQGIDFLGVWWLLMTKNYEKLAQHFVELNDPPRSKEEIIAFLKARTQRIDCTRPEVLNAVPR